mmetsp:Transcript_6639/g.15951  ORF Transcript_6639/g.15951 Transcript_6639/m.15951 type:complete len:483 (-) Transcript_6639:857-2305(-)
MPVRDEEPVVVVRGPEGRRRHELGLAAVDLDLDAVRHRGARLLLLAADVRVVREEAPHKHLAHGRGPEAPHALVEHRGVLRREHELAVHAPNPRARRQLPLRELGEGERVADDKLVRALRELPVSGLGLRACRRHHEIPRVHLDRALLPEIAPVHRLHVRVLRVEGGHEARRLVRSPGVAPEHREHVLRHGGALAQGGVVDDVRALRLGRVVHVVEGEVHRVDHVLREHHRQVPEVARAHQRREREIRTQEVPLGARRVAVKIKELPAASGRGRQGPAASGVGLAENAVDAQREARGDPCCRRVSNPPLAAVRSHEGGLRQLHLILEERRALRHLVAVVVDRVDVEPRVRRDDVPLRILTDIVDDRVRPRRIRQRLGRDGHLDDVRHGDLWREVVARRGAGARGHAAQRHERLQRGRHRAHAPRGRARDAGGHRHVGARRLPVGVRPPEVAGPPVRVVQRVERGALEDGAVLLLVAAGNCAV